MRTDFSNTSQIFEVAPAVLGQIDTLVASYGAELPIRPKDPKSPTTKTLCGFLDRTGSTDLCAAQTSLGNFQPITLTNGNYAVAGYFSNAVLAAFASGDVAGTELTETQLATLLPPPAEQ